MKLTSFYSRVATHLAPVDFGTFPEVIWWRLQQIYENPDRFLYGANYDAVTRLSIKPLDPEKHGVSEVEIRAEVKFVPHEISGPYKSFTREGLREEGDIYYISGNMSLKTFTPTAFVYVFLYTEAVKSGMIPLKEKFITHVMESLDHEIAHLARPSAGMDFSKKPPVPTGWVLKEKKGTFEEYLESPHELDANFHSLIRIYDQLAKTHTPTLDEVLSSFAYGGGQHYAKNPAIRKHLIKRFFREGLPLAK